MRLGACESRGGGANLDKEGGKIRTRSNSKGNKKSWHLLSTYSEPGTDLYDLIELFA